ncbi:hypothetical protein QBC44DRAFT_380337 [Cladorrhinum sp. PSN332]|nr:hypothetical protein QBC44DRAFT_380337 [Cladorrhinum sp. PSN332]
MLGSLPNNIYANIKGFLAPSVVDGRLNPVRLALATRCYEIQSRVFRIPDRFAFISPSPPRLQIEEVAILIIVAFVVIQMAFYGAITVFLVSLMDNKPVKSFAAMVCLLIMSVPAGIWISLCFSSRRAPDYIWEDWKARTE